MVVHGHLDRRFDPCSPQANSGYIWYDQNGQFINTSNLGATTAAGFAVHDAGAAATGNGAGGAGDLLGVTPVEQHSRRQQLDAGRYRYGEPRRNRPRLLGMTSLATAATANTVSQNGSTAGILSNITVGQDGTITGAFTNGLTTTLGKLALASFQNEDGLDAHRRLAVHKHRRTPVSPNTALPATAGRARSIRARSSNRTSRSQASSPR